MNWGAEINDLTPSVVAVPTVLRHESRQGHRLPHFAHHATSTHRLRKTASRNRQSIQPIVGPTAQAQFGANGVLTPDRTRIGCALGRQRIGASTGQVSGKKIGQRVAVDFVHEDAVQIGVELTREGAFAPVKLLEQREVHYHEDYVDLRIPVRNRRHFRQNGRIKGFDGVAVERISDDNLVGGHDARLAAALPN